MSGVRVHHPTLRNGMYTVETPRKYPTPYLCPICHRTHFFKANHIWLDDGGNGIVSTGVLADLKQVSLAGLEIVNEVRKPPPMTVGRASTEHIPIVGAHILKEG